MSEKQEIKKTKPEELLSLDELIAESEENDGLIETNEELDEQKDQT